MMRKFEYVLLFLLGMVGSSLLPVIYASNTPGVISGCVKKNGELRLLDRSRGCDKNEEYVEWNAHTPTTSTSPSPTITPSTPIIGEFLSRDLSHKDLSMGGSINWAYRNFGGINFEQSNLYGVVFSYADLRGANFTGTNLSSAVFNQTLLLGASFQGAKLQAAFINADLSKIDFTSTDLTGVDFQSSKLSQADFTNANLSGSDMSHVQGADTANFSGVIWVNTVCPDITNSTDHDYTCIGHLK